MDQVVSIFTNIFVLTALLSWAEAQILKFFINLIVTRKLDITRLFGDGGMPSGHSATVASLATITGFVEGFDSALFAVSGIMAVIVCHDAAGVRLETGKQSTVLNELRKTVEILISDKLPDVKLKEFVGHTHAQVFAGVLLGIVNGISMYMLFCK